MKEIITSSELLDIWQGNRRLTRKLIELCPEKEFFEYSIGGMRTFAQLTKELLSIALPGLKEIIDGSSSPFNDNIENLSSKSDYLKLWDESTQKINDLWPLIKNERFRETHNLFGQYEFPVIDNVIYFIENEIHHRGQAYVYLRSLNIQPPFFWERD